MVVSRTASQDLEYSWGTRFTNLPTRSPRWPLSYRLSEGSAVEQWERSEARQVCVNKLAPSRPEAANSAQALNNQEGESEPCW
jgi:hypothetical protein